MVVFSLIINLIYLVVVFLCMVIMKMMILMVMINEFYWWWVGCNVYGVMKKVSLGIVLGLVMYLLNLKKKLLIW